MGATQSRRDENFRRTDWQEVRDPELLPNGQGNYTIVRNRITGQLLDRYSLQFANEYQYKKYLESISYRRNQPNIVRVMHYQPNVVKQFCGASYLLNVYLEHCRSRLSEYEDIPFPDYLYCAMAMLDGYKKLYSKVGRFQINEQQIMIDNQGQVRVWLNSDFSQNQAQVLRNQFFDHNGPIQQQYTMVQDIMRIIFQNSDDVDGPRLRLKDFYERERINYNNRIGFEQAKNIVLSYSMQNQIQIPHLFKSVYQIYQSQQNNRMQDVLPFRNQLINQSNISSHNDRNIVLPGNNLPTVFQPVQSIVNPVAQIPPILNPNASVVTSRFPTTSTMRLPPQIQPNIQLTNRTVSPLLSIPRSLQSPTQLQLSQGKPMSRSPAMIRPIHQIAHIPNRGVATVPQVQSIPMSSNRIIPTQRSVSPTANTINPRAFMSPSRIVNQQNNIQVTRNAPPLTNSAQPFRAPVPNLPRQPVQSGQPVQPGQAGPLYRPGMIKPSSIQARPPKQVNQGPQIKVMNGAPGNFANFQQPSNLARSEPVHPSQIVQNQSINKKTSQIPGNPEQINPTPTFINNKQVMKKNEVLFNKYSDNPQDNQQNDFDETQIQRNIILKNNNHAEQDVDEQQVFDELKQFHQMQSQERQKNKKQDNNVYYQKDHQNSGFQYYNHQDEHQYGQNHEQHERNIHNNQQQYNSGHQQQFNSNQGQNRAGYQHGDKNQDQSQQQNQNQANNQKQELIHQQNIYKKISQPQNWHGGANQQFSYYNSLQLGQTNIMNQVNHLNHLNQAHLKTQINQMRDANSSSNQTMNMNTVLHSANIQTTNSIGMGSMNKNTGSNSFKKQIYYTLSSQMELDPEIAADMEMLVKS